MSDKNLRITPFENRGDWRGLESKQQEARYDSILSFINEYCATGATILDVGCGTGILGDRLLRMAGFFRSNYLGIELSSIAASEAEKKTLAVARTSAESFEANDEWDCVVFNEMLYYAKDPLELLRKYARTLRAKGIIIISIYRKLEKPTLKHRFVKWLDPRRPLGNQECAAMVDAFISEAAWETLAVHHVPVPGTNTDWKIWVVRPLKAPAVKNTYRKL